MNLPARSLLYAFLWVSIMFSGSLKRPGKCPCTVTPRCNNASFGKKMPVKFYSHTTNPSMTPSNPRHIPVTSFPPAVVPPPVGDAEGWDADPVDVDVPPDAVAALSSVWPTLGKAAFPLTIHPPGVEVGQGGGEMLAEAV